MTAKELYEKVFMEDIPHPTIPEYVQYHQAIQRILGYIKELDGFEEDEL